MEKLNTRWQLTQALDQLCKNDSTCAAKLTSFLRNKKWKPNERQQLLTEISSLFLEPQCTASICCYLRPLALDIAERIKSTIIHGDRNKQNKQLVRFTVALSIAIRICPDLKSLTLNFMKIHKPLTCQTEDEETVEPRIKKAKKDKMLDLTLCQTAWYLVDALGPDVKDYIPLDRLLDKLSSTDHDVRWYCVLTVSKLLNMSNHEKELFTRKYFTMEEEHELTIRDFTEEEKFKCKYLKICDVVTMETSNKSETSRTLQQIVPSDLHQNVVEVCGVLLPKLTDMEEQTDHTSLVPVPSMLNNLRSLALAVASGSPVLLQGPVGSGKTSIVEHLAHLTGRYSSPSLMKIQLGDQTDSKALLGIYRCTEIPGEFVWQPGILTQAVIDGHWVLLEDIDYAPMDVVSVLLPLLENQTLSVPGHGDNIQSSPNFRLFATQRLIGGVGGWHRQQSGSSVLLEKMWTKIHVEPLSKRELAQVIVCRYPCLESIKDRILDVYFLLSAGKHDIDTDITSSLEIDTTSKFLSLDGRLISTRDLMTWCGRISVDFDVQSSSTANKVFQEACDCFVSCIAKPDKRLAVAEAIGAKLNINKVKAEYYCNKYKPDIEITSDLFTVGRVSVPKIHTADANINRSFSTFSFTRQSVSLLEKVGVCLTRNEPVLLVGETGTGKTSSVQFLAQHLGHKLHVVNMNQQSDSTDLLGGFKPVDIKFLILPFREEFEILFCQSFSRKQNARFLGHIQDCFSKRKWSDLLQLIDHTTTSALRKFQKDEILLSKWKTIERRQQQLKIQIKQTENVLAFTFIEGTLVKAIKQGDWVLLDEINLASAETLECLCGLLESTTGSIILTERGDIEPVVRHENFRLFACMNPATDVGKKDLTPGIRNRFTEFYVEELTDESDLRILINDYLSGLALTANHLSGIVKFYASIRTAANKSLVDGTGHKPHYSLRTLCRALRYAATNPCGQSSRSLYEGFCLSFLTQLDRKSHPIVEQLVCKHVIGNSNVKSLLSHSLPEPTSGKHLLFEGYWISQGASEPVVPEGYILTPSVRANLRDLSRIVSAGQHPVLLQGETSVGKTSLITWLAKSTGNVCVRVNNHEHTDLQEYVGCYAADEAGKLVFKEGVLVEAMRKGHWIILDELNLAPTDVLEALNRLLDDNRELFIPETQITVKAHKKFMLFATQNPAGQYGGRKILSRAFRNRFIELHFDEIPSIELENILHLRCSIPQSYAKRLVAVMLELQTRRRSSGVFAGKQGFMTLRDLFRWAERYNSPDVQPSKKYYDWDQHLADHGYMLLAGRVRKQEECQVIQEVINKHFKRKVDPGRLFNLNSETSTTTASLLNTALGQSQPGFQHVVWTYSMRRLAVLIGQAIRFKEPVLLVGETGCGKTTVCQLYAALKQSKLYGVNCHLHTESADFLGGLRPVRSHTIDEDEESKEHKLFEWVDGPLVLAMKEAAMFLIDEISLADDSVLERLNSVLEPERRLLLAEKGGGDSDQNESEDVIAEEKFRIFATMNPGGDFGKKELSPALRNRFTEIWCPPSKRREDMIEIIEHNLKPGLHLSNQQDGSSGIGPAIMDFIQWFTNNEIGKRVTVSIRDILSWVNFINVCSVNDDGIHGDDMTSGYLDVAVAYIHGACFVFLDSLGSGPTNVGSDFNPAVAKDTCVEFLLQQINKLSGRTYTPEDLGLGHSKHELDVKTMDKYFSIPPFTIHKGPLSGQECEKYALKAPTTCLNALRVLRGLQLSRPLLLEGSPGVGKTSLVTAIARNTGRELVRINLSEQTDVTDLFGADLPVEGEKGGTFAWRDGPLLQALKAGHWVVLDELNLASQSVLEGLNACLDHRGEVYIPELGKTFQINHEETRIFGCQNPLHQGGGRKGLPRSFLNRFTQVYVEPLKREDLLFIADSMYPKIPQQLLTSMVDFNMAIHDTTVVKKSWGSRGGPWEFNLRDLFRWCDLLLANQINGRYCPGEYMSLIYSDRMRTVQDKQKVYELFESYFKDEKVYKSSRCVSIGQDVLQVGHSFLPRVKCETLLSSRSSLKLLHHSLQPLESIIKCVEMNWMAILVGPQACGKTSLIRLLAELTGNPLHVLPMNSSMDTTELLGGFEQADVCRHLEEVSVDVEFLVSQCQKSTLTNNQSVNTSSIQNLHQLWSHYTSIKLTGDESSSLEEYKVLLKRVRSLKLVLDRISSSVDISFRDDIERLSNRIEKINKTISNSEPGQGGGAFEWVDSLLVKSLTHGHWLLIDNVNFCSPSVLDRLNAVLEPSGVLSINERGVIDGKIPTIKPHQNFRLFLAMDPRHGEISRAMRNRGVEIYIPGEIDDCPYSSADTRSMLSGIGLDNTPISDWLMRVQEEMKQSLPLAERPSVNDMLRCGMVIVQQLDRGVPLNIALRQAGLDVYVRSLKNTNSKMMALQVIDRAAVKLDNGNPLANGGDDLSPLFWPGTTELNKSVTLYNTCQAAGVISHLLTKIKTISQRSDEEEQTVISDYVDKATHSLLSALILFLSQTNFNDWQFTQSWFQSFVNQQDLPADGTKGCFGSKLSEFVSNLPQYVNKCLQSIFKTKLTTQYLQVLKSLVPDNDSSLCTLMDQSWDLSHNQQILDKIRYLNPDTTEFDQQTDLLTEISYRQHMLLDVIVTMMKCSKWIKTLQTAATKASILPSSPLYVLVHVDNLFDKIENMLKSAITDQPTNTTILYQFWNHLPLIVNFLYQVQTMKNHPEAIFLSRLSLHWNWLYNKLLKPLIMAGTSSIPSVLNSILNQLQQILGQDNMAAKQFIKYLSSFGHPKPFKTESESDIHSDIRYCVDALNVYKRGNDKLIKTKVAAMVSDGVHLRKQLTSVFEALILKEENYETVKDRIQSLRVALIQKGILEEQFEAMEMDEPKPSTVVRGQTVKQSVELWPLFEHTSMLCEYLAFARKDNSVSLRNLTDFMLKYTPSSVAHLLQQQLPENVLYEEMCGVIMSRMWHSAATCNYDTWLKWNRPFQTEVELVTDRRRGPGNLHLLPLSYPLFTILSSKHNNPRESSYLPLHVPLGGVNHQLDKLSQITSHLWSTNSALSSPRFDIRYIECQHLISSFLKMLESFGTLLEPDHQQQWHDVMVEVLSRKREQQLTCDIMRLIQSLFQEVGPSVDHPAVSLISRCFEIIMEPGIVESSCLNMVIIGAGLAYVGLASVYLLAPVGPVDPVEKQAIKLNNYQNRLNEVELEIQVFEMHIKLKTGQTIADIEDNNRHIRLRYLLERRTELVGDIEILQEQQAYRPDPIQFQSLIHDVKAFLESVGSIDRVTSLLSKLKSANQMLLEKRSDMVAVTTSLREEEAWQLTLNSFLDGLDKEYWYYPDLMKPFMTVVQQMRLGISILAQKVEMEQKQSALPKQIYGQTLEDVVLVLSQFPTMSGSYETLHDLTKCLIYDTTSELVNNSLKTPDADNNQDVLSKLLMCGLYLVKLHCFHSRELTEDITLTLSNLFGAFVSAWQDQEDRRRKKEAEDASLYRFRSKTHGDERTEEEKEEAEFKSSFPSFEKEYADLVGPQTLEEVGQLTEDDDDVTSHIDSITTEEMYTVYRIHDLLFTSLVSTDWLTPKPHTPCTSEAYLQPAMLGYSIASRVAQKSLGTLGRDVDLGVVGGHLVISGVVQQTILSSLNSTDNTQDENLCLKPSEFYDVYYDSNVAEVSQCKGVLDRFIVRLEELLVEFPEHPTLVQILAIIERILSFSITCPIMKFLVGLELLLEKSKDWEANAAKHVSIMPNFTEVSAMVVQWRKLELGCWKNTMLLEERKCEKSVSKWWFHLYQLITSYLDQTQKSVDSVELLTSLKQFLEKSNLGEFKSRLQMIYALHCQVYKMDTSDKQVEVMNLLWNLYQFYHQYLPNIEAEITSQKTPIQKQLKGFVKIARWSDLNYWALKQSTEKTHRMVHKYAKKYEVILNQPVTKLLGDRGDNISILTPENQSKGSVLCERLEVYRQMMKTKKQPNTILGEIEEDVKLSDLQTRLPVLIPRLNKHWKSLVTSLNYTQLLSTLDTFTGDIVENVHELQKAEIPQGDDKEKQKKEAKFLNLRKRKSLSELFKYLTKMGLSYRKGLVLEEDTQQLDSLSLQPLDITAAMSKHKSVGGEVLSSQWENCQEYLYRCITRKAQLDQAILQPAADLGLGNSERCRGFSTHLHHLFTKQRQELGETFNNYITIRKILSELRKITRSKETSLPPQNHLKHWLERLKVLTVQLLEGLNQYLLLLDACPKHCNDGNDYISPLRIEELSPMSQVKKGDPLWQQCVDTIKELIVNTSTEHKKLLQLSDKLFLLWKDFNTVENVSIMLRSTSEKLSTMSNLFKDPISGTSCALNEPLNILEENITSCMGEFKDWAETSKNPVVTAEELASSNTSIMDIATGVDSVIENILLTVQKLLTHHPVTNSTKDGDETKSATEEAENEESDIIEGHLVTGLIGDLNMDLHELRSAQISTLVGSLVEKIETMFNEDVSKPVGKTGLVLLLRSYPLLERYCEITEYYLAHVIGSHRSCGKLLSVLLALFTELAMKGFCVPPELSDEMEKEGATDFKDIEQGGLGEGEGVKDVSDQIETEDQLDDARKAGEEKKEEDENPNVAPEDNAIEMSDDFDGKPQDLEQEGEDDKDDDKEEDEDDDIEKQMGELDEKDTDKLDEQLWGSDEEDEQEQEENPKDETGPGDGQKEENQLVAKDDNQDKTTDKQQEDDKQQQQEEKEEDQIHDMEDIQEEGYNEDKVDANQGDSKEPDPVPESMELPEDLNLDADEGGEKEEETEMEDPAEGKEDEGEITEETSDDKPEDKPEDEGEEENPEKDEESKKDDEKDNQDGIEEEKEEAGDKGVDNPEDETKDEEDRKEEEGKGDAGFTADDEEKDDGETEEEMKDKDDKSENIETQGKTSHDTPNIEESDTAQDDAAKADNQQEEKVGSGMADTQQDEGHEGEKSSEVTQGSNKNRKEKKRQPGKSDEDRSLGVPDQSYKRLKTSDETSHDQEEEEKNQEKEGDIYEHIKDSKSHHDAQTLDAATDEQLEKQSVIKEEKEDKPEEPTDDIKPMEEEDNQEDDMEVEKKESNKVKGKKPEQGMEDINMEMKMEEEMDVDREKVEIEGERILTMTVGRGPESTIHTAIENLHLDSAPSEIDLEKIRADLEENVSLWSHQSLTTPEQMAEASLAWQRYEALTSSLSQELCEQLRLVLEPSQATKLKGDYRTGKRLNMRKVIPYIASQFRKDKIWLRRTKPSKRQYQIMLAIDDSSSMLDNHSKQLAFESLALISNALTLLESGDLAISSFGESVKLLHSFTDQFSSQSGANILHQFTFEQKKTKIAQLLQQATSIMVDARSRQHGVIGNPETSQLLLIVSDGRGLFSEGMEAVKSAVRKARDANIFLVFVIIDNPENKDSILDIRVPIFKSLGKLPEIKSYMEEFPFPFYIILRDINSLPITLSDALRQWFELVTANDR